MSNASKTRFDAPMIEAQAPVDRIRRAYGFLSRFYGGVVSPLERGPRTLGLDRLAIRPVDRVLEVAVGPGHALAEIRKRVDPALVVTGVDLSPHMLARARGRVEAAGGGPVELLEADARRLPFADGTFDVLFSSYMLDLIPLADLPVVVGEFRRVLAPEGRLGLVNMSKETGSTRTTWERIYQRMPAPLVPYVFGGCRPVLTGPVVEEAGFAGVRRQFVSGPLPSEVVTARVPAERDPTHPAERDPSHTPR